MLFIYTYTITYIILYIVYDNNNNINMDYNNIITRDYVSPSNPPRRRIHNIYIVCVCTNGYNI